MAEAVKLILNGGLKERKIKNINYTTPPKGEIDWTMDIEGSQYID